MNNNLNMLNNSGLHLNERGTTSLVNNFCFNNFSQMKVSYLRGHCRYKK